MWESLTTNPWSFVFWAVWLHRYVRLLVHCVSHWTYKPIPIPLNPTYSAKDVTVIIPTIHPVFEELRPAVLSILACKPQEMLLVTTENRLEELETFVDSFTYIGVSIKALATPVASKRVQVCKAIPYVKTKIIVMADDDVMWPITILPWLLAPFEDANVGGVGTNQRVTRINSSSWFNLCINWLGAAYIERRNFEITASHRIDGGTSCMSGRTGAYRAEILGSAEFLHAYETETWKGVPLYADDDNLITRFLVNHQWKTWVQFHPDCEIETTLENGTKYFKQCLRWSRSNWRSNWTSLVTERYVYRQQPWSTYAIYEQTFTNLTILIDAILLVSCWKATEDWDLASRRFAYWSLVAFMFGFAKPIKLLALYRKNTRDLIYYPVSVAFGYLHGIIKIYALLTLHETGWGSRPGADEPAPIEKSITATNEDDAEATEVEDNDKEGYSTLHQSTSETTLIDESVSPPVAKVPENDYFQTATTKEV